MKASDHWLWSVWHLS